MKLIEVGLVGYATTIWKNRTVGQRGFVPIECHTLCQEECLDDQVYFIVFSCAIFGKDDHATLTTRESDLTPGGVEGGDGLIVCLCLALPDSSSLLARPRRTWSLQPTLWRLWRDRRRA